MSTLFPHSQSHSDALGEAQSALKGRESARPRLRNDDHIEIWGRYERSFFSALKTGDDQAAHLYLEHLTARFGSTNERILSLKGTYQEAAAKDESALRKILQDYDRILSGDASNGVAPQTAQMNPRSLLTGLV